MNTDMKSNLSGWVGVIITIIMTIAIFIISYLANKKSRNMKTYKIDSLQPYIFYIVWPILFILLIISSYYVFKGTGLQISLFIAILILLFLYPIFEWIIGSSILGSIIMFFTIIVSIILISVSSTQIQLLLTPLVIWLIIALCFSLGAFKNM